MSKRNGAWMQTYTGRQFWPLDPRPEDIDIRDIAHALANQCRFAGHVRTFYSVAEHSVRVAEIVSPANQVWALLHDAPETYLVDLPRPLKRSAGFAAAYREAEQRLMDTICEKYGLPPDMPGEVKTADNTLLATEARDLMAPPPAEWESLPEPLRNRIIPWPPHIAEREMLAWWNRLREAA